MLSDSSVQIELKQIECEKMAFPKNMDAVEPADKQAL
jgi:hypothetical protein